jgi:hypothetical protein
VNDVLFTDGPILAHVSPVHLAIALSTITMTAPPLSACSTAGLADYSKVLAG